MRHLQGEVNKNHAQYVSSRNSAHQCENDRGPVPCYIVVAQDNSLPCDEPERFIKPIILRVTRSQERYPIFVRGLVVKLRRRNNEGHRNAYNLENLLN